MQQPHHIALARVEMIEDESTHIDQEVFMKVIGAGLPRTGTLSQKVGLEMAGFGPCYHMVNVLGDLSQVAVWQQAYEGNADFAEILEGQGSSVDWPTAYYYEDLMRIYPDAKVLLSVRDGESWERSMRETIWESLYGETLMADLARARMHVDPEWQAYISLMSAMWESAGFTGGRDAAPGSLAKAMERYNDRVRETVASDRLLEWSVRDGWEPLCAFLEIEVPSAPFPRLNDSAHFADRIIDGSLLSIRQWRDAQLDQPAPPAAAPA